MGDEDRRAERLLAAQDKAAALFAAVEDRGLVAAGQGERLVSDRIAFADFGPIFEEFEADFGRTFVLGGDRVKHRLRDDLPVLFAAGREAFAADPGITGKQLYEVVAGRAADAGWVPGGWHAGHLVGEFPHEEIDGADIESYIAPGNTTPLRRTDRAGRRCHWILEIHLTDPQRGFGGFYEQLLDLG